MLKGKECFTINKITQLKRLRTIYIINSYPYPIGIAT
ncbi:hypothetical protein ATE84_0893 [Aquimarina sp. MAR_2010_214]|nr:hypothetical protein ATE84_0893 [Aquimarina sp. MAR_2010_214]